MMQNGLDRLQMACPGEPSELGPHAPTLHPPHCVVHDNRMVLSLDSSQCTATSTSFLVHFPRRFKLNSTLDSQCAVPYLVPMLIVC